MDIQEHIALAPHTTLRIGGPAKYFCLAKSIADVQQAIDWAAKEHHQLFILGGGSNVLIPDQGVDGLVVVMRYEGLTWDPPRVTVGAGTSVGQLISGALGHRLGGLAWLVGVPGTIGGAIAGNAGGREWGIGDCVESVRVLEAKSLMTLHHDDCQFGYRASIFQERSMIILEATLKLQAVNVEAERKIIAERSAAKNASQPLTAMSAGCMFRNPSVDPQHIPEKIKAFVDQQGQVAAWRCIATVGMAGASIGQMRVSEKHANFLVNAGGGTADQAVQLMSMIKQKVRGQLGIQLHDEIRLIGF